MGQDREKLFSLFTQVREEREEGEGKAYGADKVHSQREKRGSPALHERGRTVNTHTGTDRKANRQMTGGEKSATDFL